MKIPTVGTIGSIALLGGLGYVAYQFISGNWKLPDIFGAITPAPETLKETGVVGGIGDVIYNIGYPGDLREEVGLRAEEADIPFSKAVAEVVSEDIHEGGLLTALLKGPLTIGAGLGAIAQQGRYLESLPEDERIAEEKIESQKRLAFRGTPEGQIATFIGSIFPPTALILATSQAIDVARVTAPAEPTPVKQIWAPKPLPETMPRLAPPPTAAPWKPTPPPKDAPWVAPQPVAAAPKVSREEITERIRAVITTPTGTARTRSIIDLVKTMKGR